ncbi:MAG: hypothetical protein JWQ30_309, partial [Sediminibacterium sp.]|nr:hypothetical protein [Sediminibacterium sp.]
MLPVDVEIVSFESENPAFTEEIAENVPEGIGAEDRYKGMVS